jgi:hypothetical protein
MVFPRARLVVSACLFIAWLCFLLYLVVQNQHMIVLSRPQFLAAPLCIIADVRDTEGRPDPKVVVTELIWSHRKNGLKQKEAIEVKNLSKLSSADNYQGAGKYILPLVPLGKEGERGYELVPIPGMAVEKTPIYPLNDTTEKQLEEITRLR